MKRQDYYCFLTLILGLIMLFEIFSTCAAQADSILAWQKVDQPNSVDNIKNNIILKGSEVSRIASGSNTIYCINSENRTNMLYKSTNNGLAFTDITAPLKQAGAQWYLNEICVVKADPKYVAVVSDNRTKVYFSSDGGLSWANTNLPGLSTNVTIQCIDIVKYAAGGVVSYDIAVGTAKWGDNVTQGQVWIAQLNTVGIVWKDQKIAITSNNFTAEVSSLAFSPNYASDGNIVSTASTALDFELASQNKTWVCIGKRDLVSQNTTWNSYSGYPVEMKTTTLSLAGDSDNVTLTSSIALPSDYNGENPAARKIFVCYDRETATVSSNVSYAGNDAYRLDDTIVTRLNVIGGSAINLTNIGYLGTVSSGTLLAGDKNATTSANITVQVRRCTTPFAVSPTWLPASEPPSGPGNAFVCWNTNGSIAYCGTSQSPAREFDESAFSQSTNSGDTWEQISLINTNIKISDLGVAPDLRTLFLATYSEFGAESIWRSAGEPLGFYWGRVKTIATKSNRLIVRFSPNYGVTDYTVYMAEVITNNTQILLSHLRGNSWQSRKFPGQIIDMLIADKDTVYAASTNGTIRKSIDSGYTWQAPVQTGLIDINMLVQSSNFHIFTGSRDSRVSFSTNNGTSFQVIPEPIDKVNSGDVQVIPDANYSSNHIIYASTNISDSGIWRWTIGTSKDWEQIDKYATNIGKGASVTGLQVGREGTLYALRSEPTTDVNRTGGIIRTLNPASREITEIEFDQINRTLKSGTGFNPWMIFADNNTMPNLKLGGNSSQNDLFAVNNFFTGAALDNIIYRFTDNICKSGVTTINTGTIGCDPATGRNQEVNFAWEQLSLSERYEISAGKDTGFSKKIFGGIFKPAVITSPACIYLAGGEGAYPQFYSAVTSSANETTIFEDTIPSLECGHTYYWKVRTRQAVTGEIIRSPWSVPREFIIKAGFKVTTPYYDIELLAPDNACGCPCTAPVCFSWTPYKETTKYLFQLSQNSNMSNPIVSTNISNATAYQYKGNLACNTNYFWRVQAVSPAPGEWSATFSFTSIKADSPKPPVQPAETPLYVWIVIGVSFIVWICLLIVLIRRIY
jgi:hypothetical protein